MKYRRGIAQGISQVENDEIFFRYNDETWSFRTYDVAGYRGIAHYNGMHWEAKVADLRRLKKREKAHG